MPREHGVVQHLKLSDFSCSGQRHGVPLTSRSKSWSPLSSVAQCGGDSGKEKQCNAGVEMLQWSKLSIPRGAKIDTCTVLCFTLFPSESFQNWARQG